MKIYPHEIECPLSGRIYVYITFLIEEHETWEEVRGYISAKYGSDIEREVVKEDGLLGFKIQLIKEGKPKERKKRR